MSVEQSRSDTGPLTTANGSAECCEPSTESVETPDEGAASLGGEAGIARPQQSYEIGYGKPPKSRRFKPGRSGNPRGRPRRKPTSELDDAMQFERELDRTVVVTENGEQKHKPLRQIIDRQLVQLAASGDLQAMKLVEARRTKNELVLGRHRRALEDEASSQDLSQYSPEQKEEMLALMRKLREIQANASPPGTYP